MAISRAQMAKEMLPSNNYKKRNVRRKLEKNETIANGCGKIMLNRRKITKKS